jgi:large conductance mechanosensitive channel
VIHPLTGLFPVQFFLYSRIFFLICFARPNPVGIGGFKHNVAYHSPNKREIRKEVHVFKEFKSFAMRGNVVDMAVGIIIGAAFGTIVKSLVDDVIMPPIGLLLGNVDFSNLFAVLKAGKLAGPYLSLADAKAAGAVTLNYGVFLNTVISFLIVAFAVFLLIKQINLLKRKDEAAPAAAPATKECPFCFSVIPLKATRCPHCTTELK